MRDWLRRLGDWLFCSDVGGWIMCGIATAIVVYLIVGMVSAFYALHRDVIQHLQRGQ